MCHSWSNCGEHTIRRWRWQQHLPSVQSNAGRGNLLDVLALLGGIVTTWAFGSSTDLLALKLLSRRPSHYSLGQAGSPCRVEDEEQDHRPHRWSHLHLPCRYLIVSLAYWYPGMGYRGLHLQHVLTWTPKVAKATSVAANEEGCYGDGELSTCLALTGAHHTGKRSF